jgi:hypothetical protein
VNWHRSRDDSERQSPHRLSSPPAPRTPWCGRPADRGGEGVGVAEARGEPADVRLFRQHESDAGAAAARAAGAADAMHVVLVGPGRVDVDHTGDRVDVEAAGGDVGCDEGRDFAGLELRE